MPSSIVVSDPDTLQANFAANAQELFCNSLFQGGALASGAGLLFLTPLAVPGALTLAGGLIAMTHCPAGLDPEKILGGQPYFTGGQCPDVPYRVQGSLDYYQSSSGTSTDDISFNWQMQGPVVITEGPPIGLQPTINGNILRFNDAFGVNCQWGIVPNTLDINVTRLDGQPDNCGNPPGNPPGQIITDSENGDYIDESRIINNNNQTFSIPVQFDLGGINTVFNIPFNFGGFRNYSPIKVDFNIGGLRFSFSPGESTPDWIVIDNNDTLLEDLLKEIYLSNLQIQECVCTAPIELDELNLPFIQEVDDTCIDASTVLLAQRGTYPVNIEQLFEQSRVLAEKGCSEPPPNVPRNILLSGTGTGTRQIFTTGEVDSGVKVVEYEVTEFGPSTRLFIGGNNNEPQGRFGVVSPGYYDGTGEFYAMPGQAQYYRRSLLLIPSEITSALGVRVSVPVGTKFNLWDTGLRFAST